MDPPQDVEVQSGFLEVNQPQRPKCQGQYYKRLIVGAGRVHVFEVGDVNFVVASSTEFASS